MKKGTFLIETQFFCHKQMSAHLHFVKINLELKIYIGMVY